MTPVTNAITRRCTWRESLRCSSISSLASRRRLSVVLGWVLLPLRLPVPPLYGVRHFFQLFTYKAIHLCYIHQYGDIR